MIVSDVKEGLENGGLEFFISTDKHGIFDMILLINGCRHACLEEEYSRPEQNVPTISVKGDMVDDVYLREKDIPKYLIDRITTRLMEKI